jgi:steroid delta-isomerase-like uncharacterized protein
MTRATTEPERLATRYVEAWNEQDYAAIPELVSESVTVENPTAPGGVVHGRDELDAFMKTVLSGFPDFHLTVLDLLAGEHQVMYEAELTMTHEGEFADVPPTGRTVEVREMANCHVADGRIQEYRVYFDQQAVFEQLGLAE